MSAEKFIEIFKSSSVGGDADKAYAYNAWKLKNKTWINYNRAELEDMGLSKRVGFALTIDAADALGKTAEFNKLVKELKEGKPNRGPFLDESNGTPIVIFPGVPFEGGIERLLDKVLGTGTSDIAKAQNLIKGHVLGINTGALVGVKESLLASKGIQGAVTKEELNSATEFLDVLIEHLTQLDIDSSSIKNFESKILSKYIKSSRHFLVELQTKEDNAESAKLVQKLAGRTINAATGIRGLLSPGGHQKALIKKLSTILRSQGLTDPNKLLKFESSPPMLDMMADEIASAISGKKKKFKDSYSGNVPVGTIVTLYNNEQEQNAYRAKLKAIREEAGRAKAKIVKAKSQVIQNSTPVSNSNLAALLRARLSLQIKENMGTGLAKNVLNYRSGRFAESATIDRISTSREGMISVFYNYMRNPYGTFSEGGKQQSPKTRDPKTLISKSIREIGASIVSNRMRAVLV
jgi:hypothetical protein